VTFGHVIARPGHFGGRCARRDLRHYSPFVDGESSLAIGREQWRIVFDAPGPRAILPLSSSIRERSVLLVTNLRHVLSTPSR
jgi:hypothetical protein